MARSLLEPDFGTLAACRPAIKSAFWDPWETAVLGQILARSLLEPDFGTLTACRPAIKTAFLDPWERLFWAKSWPGAFWQQICGVRGPLQKHKEGQQARESGREHGRNNRTKGGGTRGRDESKYDWGPLGGWVVPTQGSNISVKQSFRP